MMADKFSQVRKGIKYCNLLASTHSMDEISEFMYKNYFTKEPLLRSLMASVGPVSLPDVKKIMPHIFHSCAKEISIMAVDMATSRIVAISFATLVTRDSGGFRCYLPEVGIPALLHERRILNEIMSKCDPFEYFNTDQVIRTGPGCRAEDYRGQDVFSTLSDVMKELGEQHGYPDAWCSTTSNYRMERYLLEKNVTLVRREVTADYQTYKGETILDLATLREHPYTSVWFASTQEQTRNSKL